MLSFLLFFTCKFTIVTSLTRGTVKSILLESVVIYDDCIDVLIMPLIKNP